MHIYKTHYVKKQKKRSHNQSTKWHPTTFQIKSTESSSIEEREERKIYKDVRGRKPILSRKKRNEIDARVFVELQIFSLGDWGRDEIELVETRGWVDLFLKR